jgi:HK97 family phage major capsid protein
MKKLLQIRAEKAALHQEMKTLVENAQTANRSLSTDESTKFDSLKAQMQDFTAQIERAEILADNERSLIGGEATKSKADAPSNTEMRAFVQTGDQRSLSAGANADGGYTVIPSIDTVIDKLLKESSVFRQNATVKTISTEKYEKLVSIGGSSAEWADETDARGETNTSQLEKVTIPSIGKIKRHFS